MNGDRNNGEELKINLDELNLYYEKNCCISLSEALLYKMYV